MTAYDFLTLFASTAVGACLIGGIYAAIAAWFERRKERSK